MRYWITHPNLTPDHDQEIEALALSDWQRSGWQIRADQAAAAPDLTPADPREATDQTPATPTDRAPSKKKGEV